MTKKQIRTLQKEKRNMLTSEEQSNLSAALRDKLFQTKEYQECSVIFSYLSIQSEIDTWEIVRHSLTVGKQVFIPRVEANGIEFYEIHSFEGLSPSKFGVLEPPIEKVKRYTMNTGRKFEDGDVHNLMLLPGLAFDKEGNRIGYGAGYYDRFLSSYPQKHYYKLALAYDFQIMDHLDSEEYDVKLNAIITPTCLIQVPERN